MNLRKPENCLIHVVAIAEGPTTYEEDFEERDILQNEFSIRSFMRDLKNHATSRSEIY